MSTAKIEWGAVFRPLNKIEPLKWRAVVSLPTVFACRQGGEYVGGCCTNAWLDGNIGFVKWPSFGEIASTYKEWLPKNYEKDPSCYSCNRLVGNS